MCGGFVRPFSSPRVHIAIHYPLKNDAKRFNHARSPAALPRLSLRNGFSPKTPRNRKRIVVASSMLGFTPVHSAVGGLLIGAAAVGRLALTGKILGVSGIARGVFLGDWSPWRLSFLSGIVSGGFLAAKLISGVFEPMIISTSRSVIGGLLVGLGSSMGNGCTSGHGICGNARLSIRSMVYTLTFMGSAFITAALVGTPSAFDLPTTPLSYVPPSSDLVKNAMLAFPAALIAMTIPTFMPKPKQSTEVDGSPPSNTFAMNLAEYVTGSVFGFGLGMSGMTLPSKIASFLSVFHPAFDLSLIFVMGGALLVALPGFQYIMRSSRFDKSACGARFQIPTRKELDAKLLIGGVVFGMGWGISGLCPGPALANIANASTPLLAYLGALGAGFVMDKKIASPLVSRLTS
ncbi:hypothetical protein BSKO_09158 [Bryopsis sp. KO-2023]|nr:hypothetical protein BSKO_09158 [Bryopsis sp. KO-2023]